MRILYTSSEGQQFDFSTLSDAPTPRITRIKSADFHTWEYWPEGTPLQYGLNVARYTRDAARYETQLYIYGTPEEREEFLESFHNAIMHDIALNQPGTLTWGEWQIGAVVISSDTYPHEELEHVTVNDLVFYCPNPRWMQRQKIEIEKGTTEKWEPFGGSSFPFDWPVGYAPILAPAEYTYHITHHVPSDFVLRIYGPAYNPHVTIGGHVYGINFSIPAQMYAEIDSRNHTVMLSNGMNLFNYRDFESSVFEKIGNGNITVKRSSDFSALLTIYKESDEPRWNLYMQI